MPLISIPTLLENMNKSEIYIVNKFKAIYKNENYTAYLYLEPKIKNLNPDLILLDPLKGVVVIEIKAWSIDYIESINNKEIKSSDGKTLHNPAYRTRDYFNSLKSLLSSKKALLNDSNELRFNLSARVFLCEIKSSEAKESDICEYLNHYPTRILYKDEIKDLSIDILFEKSMKKKMNRNTFNLIRTTIFPELRLNANSDMESIIQALDIKQEAFTKRVPRGHFHISGIPGSGKTAILIARAIYMLKCNPDWRIAIITYNKSLSSKIESKLDSLVQELNFMDIDISKIEVKTFHKFALSLASMRVPPYADSKFWDEVLPNEALKKAFPIYDAICIDEYQDFRDDWIKVCIASIKKDSNLEINIFFAGDRLQSIYNPNEINWRQNLDLDMRGRSKLLKKSYRTSSEHIDLALKLLMSDKRYSDEVERFYEGIDDIKVNDVRENSIELVEGNYFSVIEILKSLLKIYKSSDILILANSWKSANNFYELLPYEIKNISAVKKEVLENILSITTYHSSKGLESKAVIILDIDMISDKKLAYVAMTRASEKLIIHSNDFDSKLLTQEIIRLYRDMKSD